MKRRWLLVAGLVLVLATVGLYGCSEGSTTLGGIISSQPEGISVTGTGEVDVVPDIVTLRLGIEAQKATVAEAQAEAAETMNTVLAALTDSGVDEKDIQAQQYSIRQVTKWDRDTEEEIVIGYRVTHMVTAKIRDVENAGSVIDAVAGAGGDLTRIDSLSFSIDDPSAYHEEAREEAMADAKAKAEQLADLAGVGVGKPTYISEGAVIPPAVYVRDIAYGAEAAPVVVPTTISPGEMTITLTVQVGYSID